MKVRQLRQVLLTQSAAASHAKAASEQVSLAAASREILEIGCFKWTKKSAGCRIQGLKEPKLVAK